MDTIGNETRPTYSKNEKLLAAYFRIEQAVRKYKIIFIAIIVVAILAGIIYKGYGYYTDSRIEAANQAYQIVLKNPTDKAALDTLKAKSKPLYDAYILQTAVKSKDLKSLQVATASQNKIISDMASYELAVISGDSEKIATYTINKDAFYKDLAFFVLANKYIDLGDYKKANDALGKISATSELKEYANYMAHSFITLK